MITVSYQIIRYAHRTQGTRRGLMQARWEQRGGQRPWYRQRCAIIPSHASCPAFAGSEHNSIFILDSFLRCVS